MLITLILVAKTKIMPLPVFKIFKLNSITFNLTKHEFRVSMVTLVGLEYSKFGVSSGDTMIVVIYEMPDPHDCR